ALGHPGDRGGRREDRRSPQLPLPGALRRVRPPGAHRGLKFPAPRPMNSGTPEHLRGYSFSHSRKEPPVPKREEAPIGAPCWIDLFTSDPDKSRSFYEQLFGWTSEGAGEEYGGYVNFRKDGIPVAGCMRNDGQSGTPDVWSVYLA